MPSGTVYPALSRLERDGCLKSAWEDEAQAHDDGRPARRYYRLTAPGTRVLNESLAYYRSLIPLGACTQGGALTWHSNARAACVPGLSRLRRRWRPVTCAASGVANGTPRFTTRSAAFGTPSRQSPWARLVLIARCAGAPVHALWLRWDRWRIEMLLQDIKYAVRTLIKKPGFAAMTIATLAIGIGANAAIFSAVRAVILRPLPFPAPEQLVQIFATSVKAPDRVGGTASPPDFTDWRRDSTQLQRDRGDQRRRLRADWRWSR